MFYKLFALHFLVCLGLISYGLYGALEPTVTKLFGEDAATPVVGDVHPTVPTPPLPPATAQRVDPLPSAPLEHLRYQAPVSTRPLAFPVQDHNHDHIISVFGDPRGKTRRHQGIDIKAPRGTPVVAVTDGFVERIREGGSGGKQLYLRDGTGRLFYYAHLDDWLVEEFEAVRAGQPLGTVGDTGNARRTTPHLHFEVLLGKEREAVDPLRVLVGVRP